MTELVPCLGCGQKRFDHASVDLVLQVPLRHRVGTPAQTVDREPVGHERVVALRRQRQDRFEQALHGLGRASAHVPVGMTTPGQLELRQRPLALARTIVEARRQTAQRSTVQRLPGRIRRRLARRQHALFLWREEIGREPAQREQVVPIVLHCTVMGKCLGTLIGQSSPGQLEVPDRLGDEREPAVGPGLEIEHRRVVAVCRGEHERPPLALVARGPQFGETLQELCQLGGLDDRENLDRPPIDERVRIRNRRLETFFHRRL